jgi:hypothetical protein
VIPAREASSGAPPASSSSGGTFHPLPPPPPAPQQAAAAGLPRHPIDATLPNVALQQVSSGGAARAQSGPSAGRPLSNVKPLAPNNLPAGLPFRPTGRAIKVVHSFIGGRQKNLETFSLI